MCRRARLLERVVLAERPLRHSIIQGGGRMGRLAKRGVQNTSTTVSRGRGALFLDRDGVLNKLVVRDGRLVSPRKIEDFAIVDGASTLLAAVRKFGVSCFVVTNQPDIGRGLMQLVELQKMHDQLRQHLPLTDVAYCPHDDRDGCDCRKPKPGMLCDLAGKWNVSLAQSVFIGDTERDIEAGKRAGCYTILLSSQVLGCRPDWQAATLAGAVEHAVELLTNMNTSRCGEEA